METHKIVMVIGIILIALGVLSMTRITIYYEDTTRTVIEAAIKLAILAAGYGIYNKGVRMRDER